MSFASFLCCNLTAIWSASALLGQITPRQLMEEYTKAWQLEGQRRPDEAIPLLKAIIDQDKTFYRAYRKLFEIYAQEKDLDTAEHYFRVLAEQDPSDGLAHYGLANVYYHRNMTSRAGEEFVTCTQRSPEAHVCYVGMVECWLFSNPRELQQYVSKDARNPYRYLALANIYERQRKFAEASEAVRAGLMASQARKDLELEAVFHNLQSSIHTLANERFPDSLAHSAQALRLFEELGDWEGQFEAAEAVAFMHQRLGESDQALALLHRYLGLARQFEHRRWESTYLLALARHYDSQGENESALEAYSESDRLFKMYGLEWSGVPTALLMGNIYRRMGRLSEALQSLEQAHRETTSGDNQRNEPYVLRSMGALYADMGDYVNALRYQTESVRLFRQQGKIWQAGAGVGNIANIYEDLGAYTRAKTYFEVSLQSARSNQDAGEEQRLLDELGGLLLRLGRPMEALTYLRRALAMSGRVRYEPFKANILLKSGDAYMRLGQYSEAITRIRESLNIGRALGSKPLEGESLVTLGDCRLRMGSLAGAQQDFSESLILGEQTGLAQVVVAAQRGLAEISNQRHDHLQALSHLQSAIEAIEAQRNSVPTPELRASFLERNWKAYGDVIEILAGLHEKSPRQGYDREAFNYAERGRARSFLDTLSESKAQVTKGLSAETAKRQAQLLAEIAKASAALLRENAQKNRRALERAELNLSEWAVQLRATNPQYRALRYPEPYTLENIQALLPEHDTALLEYSLGDDRSHVWVITKGQARLVCLPKRTIIERAVAEYRQAVARHPRTAESLDKYQRLAPQLYDLLLRPADAGLRGVSNLIIVPDGALYYVPFETMARTVSGGLLRYVIEDFTIAYAPSASVFVQLSDTRGKERMGPERELLAFGDPEFSTDQRLPNVEQSRGELVRSVYQQGGIHFQPLPNTRIEVEKISRLYAPGQRKIYLGANATEAAVKRERLSDYRVVHFATHALINEEIPARSGVVLSLLNTGEEDGILRMPEIINLELKADLVVLSACQTGLGKLVKGEGMVGLTRAFLYAGTPRVAVSLWEVNDLATADFMKTFYRYMKAGQSPGPALRAAKLSMIHSEVPAYKHPYFWGPFVLVGLF